MTNFLAYSAGFYLSVLLCFAGQSVAQQSIVWPNGAKAAICLTYDDAMSSQLDQAIPVLNALNLKGRAFL